MACANQPLPPVDLVVQVSARREWSTLLKVIGKEPEEHEAPVGSYFSYCWSLPETSLTGVVLHSGTGKIHAAAGAQYALLAWKPKLMVLIGTCGAIDPELENLDIILATRTVVYDITCPIPGVNEGKIRELSVDVSGTWSVEGVPFGIRHGVLGTGDGDPDPHQLNLLREQYDAVAVDWESGAFAKVCAMNRVPCLILRGVSDDATAGPDAQLGDYRKNTGMVMERLWMTLSALLRVNYASALRRK